MSYQSNYWSRSSHTWHSHFKGVAQLYITLDTLTYTRLYQLQITCATHGGIPLNDISSSRQNHNIYYSEDEGRGSSASSNNFSSHNSSNTSGSRPLSTSTTGSVSVKSIQRPPLPPLPSECVAQVNLCLHTLNDTQILFAPCAHFIGHVPLESPSLIHTSVNVLAQFGIQFTVFMHVLLWTHMKIYLMVHTLANMYNSPVELPGILALPFTLFTLRGDQKGM